MLLAKLKADGKFYAVKVLQKKVILKKKEVCVDSLLFGSMEIAVRESLSDQTKIKSG